MALLSEKQQAFVDYYLVERDANRAADNAGYMPRYGKTLLGKPEIQAAIKKADKARATRCELEADRILRETAMLALSDIFDIVDISGEVPRLKDVGEKGRTVNQIKFRLTTIDGKKQFVPVDVKLWNKTAALDMLHRHYGHYLADQAGHGDKADVIELHFYSDKGETDGQGQQAEADEDNEG